MTGPTPKPDPVELQKRFTTTAAEMASLHEELYWLAQGEDGSEQQHSLRELNMDRMMELKLAVDGLRDVLWKFLDAAAAIEPERVHEAVEASKLRRVTRLLELLRLRLGRTQDHQSMSFIERISESVEEKLGGSGNKAA